MERRCPHCDEVATYVGLAHLECPTEGCPNHRADAAAETAEGAEAEPTFPLELLAVAHDFF